MENYSPPSRDKVSTSREPNIPLGDSQSSSAVQFFQATKFQGKNPPEMRWLLPDMIPDRTAGILSGNGGAGKSLLALQLGCSVVRRVPFLGHELERHGPAIVIACEDEEDMLHRRLEGITGGDYSGLDDLHLASMVGSDSFLYESERHDKLGDKTKVFEGIEEKISTVKPALVVLDNLADFNPSSEIEKTVARQFMRDLNGLAFKYDCVILLLAHPSQSGMSSGDGTSGNTAWHNSARYRLYLHPYDIKDAENGIKTLSGKKNNYGPLSETHLHYEEGCFQRWKPAGIFDGLTNADIQSALTSLEDRKLRASPQADDWVGKHIGLVLNLDPKKDKKRIISLINEWCNSGVLKQVTQRVNGRDAPFIVQGSSR